MLKVHISKQKAASKISNLKDIRVSHVWRGYGSAIFLELGKLKETETKNDIGEQTIMIEGFWRLENKKSIEFSAGSDEKDIDRITKILIDKKIESINFIGSIPELKILFEDSFRLLTFSIESRSPEWSIKLKNENWLSYEEGSFIIEKG